MQVRVISHALQTTRSLDQLDPGYKRSRESYHDTSPTTPRMVKLWDLIRKFFTHSPTKGRPFRLPFELVVIIISHIYDVETLRSCSLTCRSWHFAAASYLRYSLKTGNLNLVPWSKLHKLGLLPRVERFNIHGGRENINFTPRQLDGRKLRYFLALKNLRELWIDLLDLSSFVPNLKEYFGHLEQTLRSLSLRKPKTSSREFLYFIGFFPNLQDLRVYETSFLREETTESRALIPPSIPPLHGCLTLEYFTGGNFVDDMITLHEGFRFRRVELLHVRAIQRVLDACAETLETLRLTPTDDLGENFLGKKGRAEFSCA